MKQEPYYNYCTKCNCVLESNAMKCFVCGGKSILAVEAYCMGMDLSCTEEGNKYNEQLHKDLEDNDTIEEAMLKNIEKLPDSLPREELKWEENIPEQKINVRYIIGKSTELTERSGLMFRAWYWCVGIKQKIMYYIVKHILKGMKIIWKCMWVKTGH